MDVSISVEPWVVIWIVAIFALVLLCRAIEVVLERRAEDREEATRPTNEFSREQISWSPEVSASYPKAQ